MKAHFVCLLTCVFCAACSRMAPPSSLPAPAAPSATYQLPIHWTFFENQPGERSDENVDLRRIGQRAGRRGVARVPENRRSSTGDRLARRGKRRHRGSGGPDGGAGGRGGKGTSKLALWLYRDSSRPAAPGAVAPWACSMSCRRQCRGADGVFGRVARPGHGAGGVYLLSRGCRRWPGARKTCRCASISTNGWCWTACALGYGEIHELSVSGGTRHPRRACRRARPSGTKRGHRRPGTALDQGVLHRRGGAGHAPGDLELHARHF